jgi:hypothetical protein
MNTGPDTLGVGQIALLDARQIRRHLGCCLPVQIVRPSGKRAASTGGVRTGGTVHELHPAARRR